MPGLTARGTVSDILLPLDAPRVAAARPGPAGGGLPVIMIAADRDPGRHQCHLTVPAQAARAVSLSR